MTSSLKNYWASATPAQRFAFLLGSAQILSGVVHFSLLFLTGSTWQGAVSFRKPAAFGLSFGLTTITFGVVMGLVRTQTWLKWILLGTFSLAMVVEVFLVTLQFWRGVPSHFNVATSFDANIFAMMGLTILLVILLIVGMTIVTFTRMKSTPVMRLGVKTGLILFLISSATGVFMINHGNDLVLAGGEFSRAAVDRGPIIGEHGNLKLPHAMTLHGIQILPLLAWLLGRASLSQTWQLGMMRAGIVVYLLATLFVFLQTFQGRAPYELGF